MDDNNIGSIIVYLILAVIGIVGSISNKNKKTATGKAKPQKPGGWFDMGEDDIPAPPPVYKKEPQAAPVQRPAEKVKDPYYTFAPESEGHYDQPYSGKFGNEGNVFDQMAELYRNEGSMADPLADQFSKEGRTDRSVGMAFAGEGISSLSSSQIKVNANDSITGSEISDSMDYDYNDLGEDDSECIGFDIEKAILYSAILNRKEYAF